MQITPMHTFDKIRIGDRIPVKSTTVDKPKDRERRTLVVGPSIHWI